MSLQAIDNTAISIKKLIDQIDQMIEYNDGHALATQAAKLAIQLEHLLEHKAWAKSIKNKSYAKLYDEYRKHISQGDAKVLADAERDMTYENIEALESGIKSVLSTVKDKLHWLELENHNKTF